jgi:hypothetical protein
MEAKKHAKKEFTFYNSDRYTNTIYTVHFVFYDAPEYLNNFELFLEIHPLSSFTKSRYWFPIQFKSSVYMDGLTDDQILYFMIDFFSSKKIEDTTISDQDLSTYRTIILSTIMSHLAKEITFNNRIKQA